MMKITIAHGDVLRRSQLTTLSSILDHADAIAIAVGDGGVQMACITDEEANRIERELGKGKAMPTRGKAIPVEVEDDDEDGEEIEIDEDDEDDGEDDDEDDGEDDEDDGEDDEPAPPPRRVVGKPAVKGKAKPAKAPAKPVAKVKGKK